jgi:thioredoxin-related protein
MKRSELLINITIIVLGAAVLFFLVKTYRATRNTSAAVQEPRAGDQLPAIPGIDWKANDRTLVLALKKGCHYCEDSMPFYRQLAQLSEQNALKANLVAVFPDSSADVDAIVKTDHLSLRTVSSVPLYTLKIPGTPTIFLADRSGKIIQDWIGVLSDQQQQQLLALLQVEKPATTGSASVSANCDAQKPCGAQ